MPVESPSVQPTQSCQEIVPTSKQIQLRGCAESVSRDWGKAAC